ncbi:MAG: glutamate--tRNA ligase family protein [Kiritimatiellia bacterium]
MEEVLAGYVGRLAPSPTGALHLGNVRTFMIAWLRARACGGKVILRMEDLDHPKDKPGAAVQAIADLKWLGFDWDEEYVQSERKDIYRSACDFLHAQGLVYPCVCSRKDVEAAQSAPHAGEQLFYPGSCRGRFGSYAAAQAFLNPDSAKPPRLPCWRFRVPTGTVVSFEDAFAGPFTMDIASTLGDFPVAREAGGAGYTLAVVVDDLLMGVTEVVRGDDLLPATPAQILLAQALRPWLKVQLSRPPSIHRCAAASLSSRSPDSSVLHSPSSVIRYLHVPLVVGPDGRRLAKRHGDTRVATYRAGGCAPEELLGRLAASCGWCAPGARVALRDLIPRFTLATLPHRPFMI